MISQISYVLIAGALMGCASGNCRMQAPTDAKKADINQADAKIASSVQDRVKVFKYDGSKQCGQGKAISVSNMQKELKGITVYSGENKPDKLMHMQSCGANTGTANVYEIDRTSLEAAKKAGFREWTYE